MSDSRGFSGRIVLITGGARSGKSRLAGEMASARGPDVLYVATAAPRDPEMARRISNHRKDRPSTWRVVECSADPVEAIHAALRQSNEPCAVIVDCLTLLVSNILLGDMWLTVDDTRMDDATAALMERRERECLSAVEGILREARSAGVHTIIVTNEVGLGLVPEYPVARAYRDVIGRVNQVVAGEADEVWFVCSGIPLRVKPQPVVSGWPAREARS